MTTENQNKFANSDIGINGIDRSQLSPEEQKFADIFNSIEPLYSLGENQHVTDAAFMVYSGIAGLDEPTREMQDQRRHDLKDSLVLAGMGKHQAHAVEDMFSTQVSKNFVQK